MTENSSSAPYFPHIIQIEAQLWRTLELGELSRRISERAIPDIIFYRQLALRLKKMYANSASRLFPLYVDTPMFETATFRIHLPSGVEITRPAKEPMPNGSDKRTRCLSKGRSTPT